MLVTILFLACMEFDLVFGVYKLEPSEMFFFLDESFRDTTSIRNDPEKKRKICMFYVFFCTRP